ncbi:hypothetical protein RHGRI_021460 [Rhododendron griersonianum]|uniref:Uncharacterized protein n=1 Tax=Rhododendron griersonianum TaxID=479676 RepID=A0AAV6JKK4_9ERIC|nr:hypothetical protein RHGRI_021460 [Rhododendron griersonianum]
MRDKCFYKKEFLDFAGKDNNTARTVIITGVSTLGFVIVFIVCVCIFLRKRKQKKNSKQKVEAESQAVWRYSGGLNCQKLWLVNAFRWPSGGQNSGGLGKYDGILVVGDGDGGVGGIGSGWIYI